MEENILEKDAEELATWLKDKGISQETCEAFEGMVIKHV